MSNYNSTLQSNNIDLQTVLQTLQTKAAATPVISVSSDGLITATAGTKTSTHQLAFQSAKTITPSSASQIAVSSGYYTGGDITVAGDSNLIAENIISGKSIFGITGTATTDPFDTPPLFTYTINSINGAQYGFIKNSNGYYESQNKGQNNSYAICRVNLTVTKTCDITFDVINYAESSYDYALFGNLNKALTLSYTADTNNVKENFKGKQSASVVNVTYNGVTAGNHFIDIKFVKDSSQHNNNDSVQFKLQEQDEPLSQELIDKILAADADLVAENIKSGVNIFGVNGTYGVLQAKTVIPTANNQDVVPDSGYTGLSKVTVTGDTNLVAGNIKSGISIFGVNGTYTGDKKIEDGLIMGTISSSYTNDRVTTIRANAFYSCSKLMSVNFPAVTSIGSGAFYNCPYLKASIPAATYIGDNAFNSCYYLYSAIFPVASYIGSGAFAYCNNLRTLSFPVASYIGDNAFYRCYSLTTVDFPAATNVGNLAFAEGCVTSANFPVATSIGSSAFYSCRHLITANFPAVTDIGYAAFQNCSSLATISFPAATTIGSSAFYYCFSLTTANFPSATTIGSQAFANDYHLTTANFPAATTIGDVAFWNCTSLTTADFPAVTSIGSGVFSFCTKLTTVNFSAATTIGSSAFYCCSSLATADFPAATTIYKSAFKGCKSLSVASFPAATTIDGYAFQECRNLKSLYLTGSSVCTLTSVTAFFQTPLSANLTIGGDPGSIYVPASLLTSYQTATNWVQLRSRFVAF